ncbi:hypothetical protein BDV24DRAFT_143373 [Aspergillus arachidicola]|uniref:Uncharacterized protein n=1 Tax=Aspergillus arachidicola TaxID=656916 RepID=A0A5N6XR33_9EURO|nr:hypothetical protein BDV24DRAFT_143373 [Aspergillus arachidicola]
MWDHMILHRPAGVSNVVFKNLLRIASYGLLSVCFVSASATHCSDSRSPNGR